MGKIGMTGIAMANPVRMPADAASFARRENTMLYGLILVLVVLWALGLATSYTLGGLIHILLVVALVIFVMNLISGRRA